MEFLPVDRMWSRVEITKNDSDTALFFDLMYFGELLVKTTVSGLVAAVDDDRERHRYRQVHRLVRADGLGDWSRVADEVLLGPPAQCLMALAYPAQKELIQKLGPSTWQYDSVTMLHQCLKIVEPQLDNIKQNAKIDGRQWIELFARLRNKTRGHGAIPSQSCSMMCPLLEESIRLYFSNLSVFQWPWAYLHQNLSGKYRITPLNNKASDFNYLKSKTSLNLSDGVYVHLNRPARVDLMHSNVDASDFFYANGGFGDKTYELISYTTGSISVSNSAPWMAPANLLPNSETQGIGTLETEGFCFHNLPSPPEDYVKRADLEAELSKCLSNDRHPIITLVGRGGIGKTSLALKVLHNLTQSERFMTMFWFSARDIDLLPDGPKIVQPHVLTEKEIAKELVRLAEPNGYKEKAFDSIGFLCKTLETGLIGPSLFIFDNFETVKSPVELYTFIDTYIRAPHKVLITTRFREFKGDYPVEVAGMTEPECTQLVRLTAERLGIVDLISDSYFAEIFRESDGHPYVVKVLLGEVAKAGQPVKVERIIAGKDDILGALFERTYKALSVAAQRIFLTLCAWRSTVPLLAVEAVLLRPVNERMDVEAAVEELSQSSFIEIEESALDRKLFLSVPLAAAVFGLRKLSVSPMKTAVEADVALLQAFGASQKSDIRHGIGPRVERLFKTLAYRIGTGKTNLPEHLPMLEFVASHYPPAWLLMASLQEEFGGEGALESAKDAVRRYLEYSSESGEHISSAWKRLAELCRQTEDWIGQVHAEVEMCQFPDTPFKLISTTTGNLNHLLRTNRLSLDSDEKRVLVNRLAQVMETRFYEASWGDYSQLGWLYVHLGDITKAIALARLGLNKNPGDYHCKNLLAQLDQ